MKFKFDKDPVPNNNYLLLNIDELLFILVSKLVDALLVFLEILMVAVATFEVTGGVSAMIACVIIGVGVVIPVSLLLGILLDLYLACEVNVPDVTVA